MKNKDIYYCNSCIQNWEEQNIVLSNKIIPFSNILALILKYIL